MLGVGSLTERVLLCWVREMLGLWLARYQEADYAEALE